METRGVFIVIEGSDGSGKATQLKLVQSKLEAAGYQVETFDFPRYDEPSSYFVKRYLKGDYGSADDVGPYTSSLFYALDRFEAAPKIREALAQGKIVISNRFTGSNMAHQGTKIGNSEQRRGFFIWLDNLEFEMLRIPRPDISFILRVPAEISQKLMADREKDIHEADTAHLERTVAVYDDMAQLFPKDFQRIDCVRGGQLADIQTINSMLWEKIHPLLPQPTPGTSKAEVPTRPEESNPEEPTPARIDLTLANASSLLVQKVERIIKGVVVELPDIPSIYTPTKLIPEAEKEYQAKTSTLLGLYAKLVAGLAKHGISTQDARQAASQALPIAAAATIRIGADSPNLEELIVSFINDSLPEAQQAGADLFAQAIQANAERFKGVDKPIHRSSPLAVKALSEEFLSENHIGDHPPVQLTEVWPRNESDLVADMLYAHSSLPLRTIQSRMDSWPINRKLAVFEAYIGDGHPGLVLEKAHYSWDLLCPYSTFCDIQRHPSEALEIQTLTPRYGYDMPQIIEDADLSDTFEECFDLSLEFYSMLQKTGHQQEAQYAVLRGHNQRFKMTQNASQALRLFQASEVTPSTKQFLKQMQEKLAEIHPILSEIMTPNDAEVKR